MPPEASSADGVFPPGHPQNPHFWAKFGSIFEILRRFGRVENFMILRFKKLVIELEPANGVKR